MQKKHRIILTMFGIISIYGGTTKKHKAQENYFVQNMQK